ncbi:hypothetical protein [Bosea sp. OK403]|uniref:hypothetical protein n=1 Tax=Bosea sp. OK403 TaxID=1855286 RepID=UPI000B1B0D0B|nr:hypothetical protein [Bosea sp. OK403]
MSDMKALAGPVRHAGAAMSPPPERSLPTKILLAITRGVLTVLVLLDEIARPLYRPLADWLASLGIVARAEAAIARLPRLAILALLAIPFAVAEPLKIVGLIMIGRGQVVAGIMILAVAYLASFLIVERIYQAGRGKLLSYRWLAWLMAAIETVRVKALSWVKASTAYQSAIRIRDEARRWLRGLRA